MRSALLLTALLLLLLLAGALAAGPPTRCAALRAAWLLRVDDYFNKSTTTTIQERSVRVNGKELTLEVWGAGGAPRAAAAVLVALTRALLGYRADLRLERASLCDLAKDYPAALAPAALLPHGGCNHTRPWVLDELTSLYKGMDAAAPSEPLLHAHVPNTTSVAECARRAAEWRFYARVDGEPGSCELARENGSFVVFARNDSASDDDARALAELQKRAREHGVSLAVRTSATDVDFRRKIVKEREQQRGFLFVDEDIWADDPLVARVQPPPCACAPALLPRAAVRVGAGAYLRRHAPGVARLVAELALAPSDLRAILRLEARQSAPDVVEAACHWALDSVDSLFQKLFLQNSNVTAPTYTVGVHPCNDDPDLKAHEDAAEYLRYRVLWNKTRVDVAYSFEPVNCSEPGALRDAVARRATQPRALGAVVWSAAPDAPAARREATIAHLPLLLVGAAPEEPATSARAASGKPVTSARAASGALAALANAFRHLLDLCAWSRVAVLSDHSTYAQSFASLLLAVPAPEHRAATLDESGVAPALDELRRTDARVVVLNAPWPLADRVLCEAWRRGLGARRVWLLLEARKPGCDAAGMRVLALGVSWRGGAARGGSAELREGLRRAAWPDAGDALGPPLTAALVDALTLITLAFDKFMQDVPWYRHDLRGSVGEFTKYLDNLNETGVAGNLEYERFALKDPAVYVERWTDGRGATVAVWRVTRSGVRAVWPAGAARCECVLGGPRVPDRAACATLRAGDAFAPRCLDTPLFASAAFLLLGALALALAARARRVRRGRREREWRRRLAEQRRRATSALGAFLVERGAIRLLHEIGAGCYGRVHFAELRRGGATLLVAAKEPRADAAPAEEGEFLREACVLARLRHAHVVRLLGVCVADGPPTVLLEHALHLDLQRYLAERRARGGRELAPRALTRLAREAAEALAYVAARRLVHRDVRAANCLVDARRSLKLADFGMARELGAYEPEYASRRRGMFPVLWMAPESLAEGVFSPASDVWALGVLLLELATLGARPYGRWAPARVLRYVTAGGRPPLPPDLAPDTCDLVLRCWQRAPERRPSAADVARVLAGRRAAVRAALLPPPEPPDCGAGADGVLHV